MRSPLLLVSSGTSRSLEIQTCLQISLHPDLDDVANILHRIAKDVEKNKGLGHTRIELDVTLQHTDMERYP